MLSLSFVDGLLNLPWWGALLATLGLTHVTIIAVTIYLHRHQAHRALSLHPAVAHFFRAWLWLTTGMGTRGWTAVHRKHHAFVELAQDPHSPSIYGIRKVLTEGVELYRKETSNAETLAKYSHGTPDDWLERQIYERFAWHGIGLMLAIDLVLFGCLGLTVWAVQMMWIPIFAAGVINGLAHWWGYRNFETPDRSTNVTPWGLLVGGEELHNNHHAFASSARFSLQPWEFDLGWAYIRVLERLGLANVKKVVAPPRIDTLKSSVDLDTLRAVVASHVHVLADYAQRVVHRVHRDEIALAPQNTRRAIRPLKRLIYRAERRLGDDERACLALGLTHSRALTTVYDLYRQLVALFNERQASQDRLLHVLQQWCREAEETGIAALSEFAQRLAGYRLAA